MILKFMGLSPELGSVLTARSLEPALDSLVSSCNFPTKSAKAKRPHLVSAPDSGPATDHWVSLISRWDAQKEGIAQKDRHGLGHSHF